MLLYSSSSGQTLRNYVRQQYNKEEHKIQHHLTNRGKALKGGTAADGFETSKHDWHKCSLQDKDPDSIVRRKKYYKHDSFNSNHNSDFAEYIRFLEIGIYETSDIMYFYLLRIERV